MLVFIDTEFTDLKSNAQLISLGAITEYGDKFYAEIADYDKTLCSTFVKDTVIPNLLLGEKPYLGLDDSRLTSKNDIVVKRPLLSVGKTFVTWLLKSKDMCADTSITFVSDVCHYDGVLVMDLIQKATNDQVPSSINPMFVDISTLLTIYAKHENVIFADMYENYDDIFQYAFDVNREEFSEIPQDEIDVLKHNSLWDACVIKECYYKLMKYFNRDDSTRVISMARNLCKTQDFIKEIKRKAGTIK